jgi:hypothetical protein
MSPDCLVNDLPDRSDDFVVFGMRADPEPQQAIRRFDGDCPIVEPDTSRPEAADLLEAEGGVSRVGL